MPAGCSVGLNQGTEMSKLNEAFAELEREGYFAKQNFQCCQTCGWAAARVELKAKGVTLADAIYKSSDDQKIVFYHLQDAIDLEDTGMCRLAWRGDGNQIRNIMNKHGIFTCWNGSEEDRIGIFFPDWQEPADQDAHTNERFAKKLQSLPATGATWKAITKDRYMHINEWGPPACLREHPTGFNVLGGDPYSHRTCSVTGEELIPTYAAVVEIGDNYFESEQAMTVAEFREINPMDVRVDSIEVQI